MEKKHENSHMKITKDGKLVDFKPKKDSKSARKHKNDMKDTQWKFHSSSNPVQLPLSRELNEALINEDLRNSKSDMNVVNLTPSFPNQIARKKKAKSTSSSNSDNKNIIQRENYEKKYKSENSLFKMSIDFITSPP